MNLDPWHLNGTFYCRAYKIKTLEIIKKIKPNYYVDIGCGIGEILNKVELSDRNKFGFDIDEKIANIFQPLIEVKLSLNRIYKRIKFSYEIFCKFFFQRICLYLKL